MSLYNETVMEHFLNPKNVGVISNANCIGESGSNTCNDVVRIYLDIKNDLIRDAKFETFGCTIAIASSSVITELVIGKNVNEVLNFKIENIIDALGGIPEEKIGCANLVLDSLKLGLEDYYKNKKEEIKC